jgi:hypothetical protein
MDDSKALIALVGVMYLYISVRQGMKADSGVALMFFGYAVAQIGIYFQAK